MVEGELFDVDDGAVGQPGQPPVAVAGVGEHPEHAQRQRPGGGRVALGQQPGQVVLQDRPGDARLAGDAGVALGQERREPGHGQCPGGDGRERAPGGQAEPGPPLHRLAQPVLGDGVEPCRAPPAAGGNAQPHARPSGRWRTRRRARRPDRAASTGRSPGSAAAPAGAHRAFPALVPHAGPGQGLPHVGGIEMDVGLAGGRRGAVREQPGDDLDRHAAADQLGGVRVPQHVRGEGDPGARGDAADQLVHRRVAQRLPDPPAEQVDEHVVGVDVAVLGVHVLRVQPHQRRRHRDHRGFPQLGARPVGVAGPGHDMDLPAAADEVAMPQPERLAHAHPGLGQQRQQEPVPQVLAGSQDRGHLPGIEGARRPAGHGEPDRPGRDRLALGHMVQERLIGAAADPAPGDQLAGNAHPAAGVVVIEAEHRCQVTVHRRRRTPSRARLQHDHVLRRGPQPGHEPGHILHAGISPADAGLARNSNHSRRLIA